MSFFEDLQIKSLRTRWLIAILTMVVLMAGIIYFWYASFKNLLSGSFEVKNQEKISVSQETEPEGFLSSLKGLLSDLSIDISRWKEFGASLNKLPGLFDQVKNSFGK